MGVDAHGGWMCSGGMVYGEFDSHKVGTFSLVYNKKFQIMPELNIKEQLSRSQEDAPTSQG